MRQIKQIITHAGKAHQDDFLASCLLLAKYPVAELIRKDEVSKELKDKEIVVLDVGGQYNSEFNNYDHHQNADLPCALHLVAKNLFPEINFREAFQWWDSVDYRDRNGVLSLYESVIESRDDFMRIDMMQVNKLASPVSVAMMRIFSDREKISKDELYYIMQLIGRNILDMAKSYQENYGEIDEIDNSGLKIAYTEKEGNFAVARFAEDNDCDIIVAPNERGEGFTITIPNGKNGDFNYLRGKENVTFVHNSGFMAVVSDDLKKWRKYLWK